MFLIGAMIGGTVAGAVCGCLPLGVGLSMKRPQLAWGGLIASTFSGTVLGLCLAVPVAVVFTVIIASQGKPVEDQYYRPDVPPPPEDDKYFRPGAPPAQG